MKNLLLFIGLLGVTMPCPVLGATPPAEELDGRHFPDRMHVFIWRNWECVSLEKMAKVLGTTPENIEKLGRSMGLPSYVTPVPDYQTRGYVTILRRNWHLVSKEQLMILLDWDAERLDFTLREDDFLYIKLGATNAKTLHYAEPGEEAEQRCREIKKVVESNFGAELEKPGEPRFDFVRYLSEVDKTKKDYKNNDGQIRFIYSYMSIYGDPLLDSALDPFPEGLLQKYAEHGVNGIWLHTVLWTLAPSRVFPEAGQGSEQRLSNLKKMVERAKRYGIKIYLYLNEPRPTPSAAGNPLKIPNIRCTSDPRVREWLKDSLAHVFKTVPGLGGIFTITAAENYTNCWYALQASCPVCKKRGAGAVIGELNSTMAEGVWIGNPNADVIVWDWSWPDNWVADASKALPKNVYFMTMSEFGIPINRGGVPMTIWEYCMSVVGPGERAEKRWEQARQSNLKVMAKVALNNTWETSAVPYIPAMNLVAEHCRNLNRTGVDGFLLSWSLGGYPSPNLKLASIFRADPDLSVDDALRKLAVSRFGEESAPDVLKAWTKFSEGFSKFPFALTLYNAPTQMGPANLLYPLNTQQKSTMVCYNFDDLAGWIGKYSAHGLAAQLDKVTDSWQTGLPDFQKAIEKTNDKTFRKNLREDLGIAEAVYITFKSTSNQIKFTQARNKLEYTSPANEQMKNLEIIKTVTAEELLLAKRFYSLVKQDSRIGFESTNHYYYLPLDLVEKVVSCDYILNHMELFTQSQSTHRQLMNWTPEQVKVIPRNVEWQLADSSINGPGTYTVTFRYTGGSNALAINSVALCENGNIVCNDSHGGFTGFTSSNNTYSLSLSRFTQGAKYTLRANIYGSGGSETQGEIILLKVSQKRTRTDK